MITRSFDAITRKKSAQSALEQLADPEERRSFQARRIRKRNE